jgi:hypothetical protein
MTAEFLGEKAETCTPDTVRIAHDDHAIDVIFFLPMSVQSDTIRRELIELGRRGSAG